MLILNIQGDSPEFGKKIEHETMQEVVWTHVQMYISKIEILSGE